LYISQRIGGAGISRQLIISTCSRAALTCRYHKWHRAAASSSYILTARSAALVAAHGISAQHFSVNIRHRENSSVSCSYRRVAAKAARSSAAPIKASRGVTKKRRKHTPWHRQQYSVMVRRKRQREENMKQKKKKKSSA